MFGFRTDNILPKDGYVGLNINTGKVYETEKFGKVFIYFDGSSLNMFSVGGTTLKIYFHNLWDTRIEEDSFYAPIESLNEYDWEEIGGGEIIFWIRISGTSCVIHCLRCCLENKTEMILS